MGVRRGGGFVCDLAAAHAFSGRPGNGWGIAQHVWSLGCLVSSPSSPKSRLGMQDNLKFEQEAALKWVNFNFHAETTSFIGPRFRILRDLSRSRMICRGRREGQAF